MFNILLVGCCNWFSRDFVNKILQEKDIYNIICVDNLSSELSSRIFSTKFEYLDIFSFKYMDIVSNPHQLYQYIDNNTIIVFNIWREPDSIIGIYNIVNICRLNGYHKLIYTSHINNYKKIHNIINILPSSIGILYEGELVGKYGIPNKRDIIDTIKYYKKIRNNYIPNETFDYYTMESCINFIYFLIKMNNYGNQIFTQPVNHHTSSQYY